MAAFTVMAVLTIAGNLAADLTYGWIDPRITLE
jgi:ABC-type dipeptide/oligopeptide/nickel transport system permease component